MSTAKRAREDRRQLGQFFTPPDVARRIVAALPLEPASTVLEPSFGEGAFVFELVNRVARGGGDPRAWAASRLFGTEMDDRAYETMRRRWRAEGLGPVPPSLRHGDFFRWKPRDRRQRFDLIVGNPPFGGTLDAAIEDELDRAYGRRHGLKIKKETYSFFIVRAVELLAENGLLCFVCSDTLLTINTMRGLRNFLHASCDVEIEQVPGSFDHTAQPLILLKARKTASGSGSVKVFGVTVPAHAIAATPNLSWRIGEDLARYFTGTFLGDFMVATSGMTTGNNELFLREIRDGRIAEPYRFAYADEPVTLTKEFSRARLGKISAAKIARIREAESRGATERVVRWTVLPRPRIVTLPHADYRPYNKADASSFYAPPRHVIYWRDGGDYVYTFKRNGNWYLHGVGGRPFFEREGLTWALIANRFKTRYLPPGSILDSGAPCAFLRPGVAEDELYFILAWTLTPAANRILKSVLNHTRNIQSKDFERMPYPAWVAPDTKREIIALARETIARARAGHAIGEAAAIEELERLFAYRAPERGAVYRASGTSGRVVTGSPDSSIGATTL
ncbi:MAG TPA: N-6 DNA methylase [Candidatus Elarobacter sp.]|nr:N-6 DNA methylase [Candidatus Elarobacter sp.]